MNYNVEEVWKDIPGFEGRYQISNFQRVKSLARKVKTFNGSRIVQEKILNPVKGKVTFRTQYTTVQFKVEDLYEEAFGINEEILS